MLALMPNDPWGASCDAKARVSTPAAVDDGEGDPVEDAPLDVAADYAEMQDREITTFTGAVDVRRARQRLLGDFVSYDRVAESLYARGNVRYREKGATMAGDSAFLKLGSGTGTLRNAQFIFESVPSRATSRVTHFESRTLSRHEQATYTSCRPGNEDWLLHASTVRVDRDAGRGAARNAWLEFKGVPVLYTPYLSFPIDDRRTSGFLTPSFSTASRTGFAVTLPYYLNLAPNYDATFYPRYMTRRGGVLGGEFRYVTATNRGQLDGEIVPQDEQREQMRGRMHFVDRGVFSPQLSSEVKLNYVSDNNYLYEMISALGFTNRVFLHSFGNLAWKDTFGDLAVSSAAYLSNYQVLDEAIPNAQKPYRELPRVALGLSHPVGWAGAVAKLDSEYTHWDHSDNLTGSRTNFRPSLSFPWENSWGFLKPSLSVQHTHYWLSDLDKQPKGFDFNHSVGRTTPILSADSGLVFERDLHWSGTPMSQTLEPRLFYLYVPYQDQKDIPVFAASPYDFTFYQLFRENRYTGIDRMSDANQISIALTTRLVDQSSGRERFRGSIGKILEFQEQRTRLDIKDVLTATNTALLNTYFYRGSLATYDPIDQNDIIADFSAALTDTLSIKPLVVWNHEENRPDRLQTNLQYRDGRNRILNLGYRFRRNLLEIADVSARLPLLKEWYAVGRMQYSVQDMQTLDSFLGVERESCCWRFSLIGRRWVNNLSGSAFQPIGESDYNVGFFLQVELKGLTRLGYQVDNFLERSISGYDRPDW